MAIPPYSSLITLFHGAFMIRKIVAIAWKDSLVRFASRSELLFFVILPLTFTLILGRSFQPTDGDNRITVVLVNEDEHPLTAEFIALLEGSGAIRPELMTAAEAETAFEDGAVAWLTIPAGFGQAVSNGTPVNLALQTAPNNTNTMVAEQAIAAAAGEISQVILAAKISLDEAEQIRPFASEADRQTYFEQGLELAQSSLAEAPERLVITRPETTPTDNGFNNTAHQSAGQLITWVFIPLLGTSALLAYERTNGTLRRLLTTPTTKATFLLGTITGQLTAALVQMLILVGVGQLILGLQWSQDPLALAVMLITFGLAAVALGTMLGTFVKTEQQASGLSIMLGMTMALLGGCWFPLEFFPPTAQTIARLLPTSWAMEGLTDLVTRGQALPQILPEAGVLMLFAILFFIIGVRRFRYE